MTGAADRAPGAVSAVPETSLFWLEGSDGTRHYLDSVTTVGRAEGNDIRLASPTVSRFHAMLRSIGGDWVAVDLDSRNGTRVRGDKITTPRILRPNDPIQFGDTPFMFRTVLNLDGGQQEDARFAVRSHTSDHFRLLVQPGSFADLQEQVVAERLERVYAILVNVLRIDDASEPITVYLLDQIADPDQPDQLIDDGGYARPDRRLIYAVYRPESPGLTLERDLLQVEGAHLRGFASWPESLRDALVNFVTRRADPRLSETQPWDTLFKAFEAGDVPSLDSLLAGRGAGESEINTLALTHFLEHAATTYGLSNLSAFLVREGLEDPDSAARAAFGRSLRRVNKAWRGQMKSATLSGMRLFVKLLFPYLRPYPVKLVEISIYVAISVAFGIALAKAEGLLVDKALIAGDFHMFEIIMGGLAAAFVITSLASLRENWVKAWVSAHLLSRIRLSMFRKVQSLEPGYFDRTDSGDVITRLTSDVSMVESALSSGLVETVRFSLMFSVALIVIFFTEWKLAFVTVVGVPLFLILSRFLGRPVTRASMDLQMETASVTNDIHENLGAQPVVKLFGLEQRASESFSQKLERLVRSSLKLHFLGGLYSLGSNSITSFVELAVLTFGGYLVLRGHSTTGTLITFMTLVGQIVTPMQLLSQFFQMVQTGSGSMKRINELLSTRPAIDDTPQAQPIERLSREIQLEHVLFSYDGTRHILEDVSLHIPVGANVAIVGPSGSGKSTILNLLNRFYDPDYGRVTMDGVDLRDATIASVRGQIGMVFQDSFLFNESIRENIRMANPSATDDEVEAAARAAEMHDFITQLPDGYDTLVGERGGHLSGGQRQRVAIARAILRNPALLLLDEATSALDPTTEAAINQTLRRVAQGRTTISVTHRLASVVDADLIAVLDRGRLVEQGTHDELLRAGGLYTHLWEEQQGRLAGSTLSGSNIDLETLQRIPLFASLDRDLIASIALGLSPERFEAGSTIVTAGEAGDRMYLINRGEVEVLAGDWEGQTRRLAVLGEGDYFGEIALLRDVRRTATVRARTSVELFSLSRESFQGMVAVLPELRRSVMRTVAQREESLRSVAHQDAAIPRIEEVMP